jgi:hypothetical protein
MSNVDRQIVRKTSLAEQGNEDDLRNTSVEDRWNMVWQLTVEEWLKKGIDITDLPMRKDVVRRTRLWDQ